jgi:tetratricopeptide (TPR) repeat protein
VAAGLHVVLQPEETEAIEARPTENLAAYDLYLRGMEYYERGRVGQNWEVQLLALEMFDSAATLDPDFALAHVMRFNAHFMLSLSGYDSTVRPDLAGAPRRALARSAVDEAMRVDPELAAVQKALGLYYGWSGDLILMEEHFARVIRTQPNDVDALLWLARIQGVRGEWDSAEVRLRKADDLDPRSAATAANIGSRYSDAGRYEDALRYAARVVSLAGDQPGSYSNKAWLHVRMSDTAAAHQTIQLGAERVGLVNLLVNTARANWGHILFRIFDDYGDVIRGLSLDAFGIDTGDYVLAKASAYHATPDLARPYFDSLAAWATARRRANPDSRVWRALLAQAHAGSGRNQAAMEQAETLRGEPAGGYSYFLLEAFVMLGDHDAAVEHLRDLISRPRLFSPAVLWLDPIWNPLRDHPGFQELLEGGNQGVTLRPKG